MPFVHIQLIEGRTPEQKKAMARKITDVIVSEAQCPVDAVHVIFTDLSPDDYARGGETYRELKAKK